MQLPWVRDGRKRPGQLKGFPKVVEKVLDTARI